MPPEYVRTSAVAKSVRSSWARSSSLRVAASAFPMPRKRPMVTRFRCADIRSSTVDCWEATPICSRTRSGCDATSMPATVAEPSVGRLSVVRMRMAVVLPAPL